jgi:hypothetical protein
MSLSLSATTQYPSPGSCVVSCKLDWAGPPGKCLSLLPFQDNNGVIGLLEPMKKSMVPVQVQLDVPVVKVASGELGVLSAGWS